MLDEVLFSISVAQSLRQLEELTIEGIDGLKHIIGSTSMGFNLSPQNSRSLMPSLNKIHIACCIKLESLLPICCVEGLVQLQEVKIVNLPKLKYVFGECDHMDHSSLQYENQIMLPRLKDLRGKYLSNLIDMCPENYSAKWSFPSEIIMEDCPKFAMTAGLQLHAIFSVECNLQNLKFLTLKDCMLGEVLFSVSVAQSLQQLRELTIEGIHGLKHIIGSRRGHGSSTSRGFIQPQDSRFLMPNLNEIHVARCNKLESLLPICFVEGLVQLQRISMRSLPELKYVFGECNHTDHSSLQYESQILLSRLENLKLCNLQNLNDMCPGNYPVNWPSALNVDMIVIGCPKL
ncbi:hypothetical protein VNO77_44835 [Canavalia gladiata]|uniref:Uncharacterized protein n=1 Tax=Canavalia gladiata TaxID=3824 RepID=A0AAN9PP48_CANGL